MVLADLKVRCLGAVSENRWVANSIHEFLQKISPRRIPTARLNKMKNFLPKANEIIKEARESYRQALEFYKKASHRADRHQVWLYQGQVATAYVRLYNISKDPQHLSEARKTLDEALEDKEDSPYLDALVRLRKTLKGS